MRLAATVVYAAGILVLFYLNREKKGQTSKALWLPVIWMWINASRPVSVWLGMAPADSSDLYMEGSPVDRNVFILLILSGLVVLLFRQTSVRRLLRNNWPVVMFALYCLASTSWSDYPEVAIKRWFKLVGDLTMVLIVLTDPELTLAVRRLITRVSFVLIPSSVLLIKYYPEMSRYYSRWEGTQFVSGVAQDKNMLGMTCMVFGLGTIWCLLIAWRTEPENGRARRLLANGTVLAMVLWLFWLANSMTSTSCFVMAGLLLAATFLFRRARRPKFVHLAVGFVLLSSVSVLFLGVSSGALAAIGRNPTLTGRTAIWANLLKVAQNPVLGTGFESFWLGARLDRIWNMAGYMTGINESHNGYIETYLNLGWVGVTLLGVLIFTGYRRVTTQLKSDSVLGPLCIALLTSALVYCMTEAAFKITCPVWISFLVAIMLRDSVGQPFKAGSDSEFASAVPIFSKG